jgi:hypothetical protein
MDQKPIMVSCVGCLDRCPDLTDQAELIVEMVMEEGKLGVEARKLFG